MRSFKQFMSLTGTVLSRNNLQYTFSRNARCYFYISLAVYAKIMPSGAGTCKAKGSLEDRTNRESRASQIGRAHV